MPFLRFSVGRRKSSRKAPKPKTVEAAVELPTAEEVVRNAAACQQMVYEKLGIKQRTTIDDDADAVSMRQSPPILARGTRS